MKTTEETAQDEAEREFEEAEFYTRKDHPDWSDERVRAFVTAMEHERDEDMDEDNLPAVPRRRA